MIQLEILLVDLHRSHLGSQGSPKVFFFASNTWLKIVRDVGVISLWLSRHEASTDMEHDLLILSCDLDLRSMLS